MISVVIAFELQKLQTNMVIQSNSFKRIYKHFTENCWHSQRLESKTMCHKIPQIRMCHDAFTSDLESTVIFLTYCTVFVLLTF